MKKFRLFVFHAVIAVTIFSLQALAVKPSVRLNVQREMDFPNDEKQIFVRKIRDKGDMAILFAVQIVDIDQDRRYFVEDDYEERNMLCQTFGFKEAFNNAEDSSFKAPLTSLGSASDIVRLGEDNELTPYPSTDKQRVSMIEILPCKKTS